jgi:hypothetical protein
LSNSDGVFAEAFSSKNDAIKFQNYWQDGEVLDDTTTTDLIESEIDSLAKQFKKLGINK